MPIVQMFAAPKAMLARLGGIAVLVFAANLAWGASPPPRSASDIAALLDSYQPDSAAVAALKATLAEPAPLDDTLYTRRLEYWDRRAEAAESLGLFTIELAARRRVVEIMKAAGNPEYTNPLTFLANREMFLGNLLEGQRLLTEVSKSRNPSNRGTANVRLAIQLAWQGASQEAEQHLSRAAAEYERARLESNASVRARYGDGWAATYEGGRGVVLTSRGKLSEAEVVLARATTMFREHAERTQLDRDPSSVRLLSALRIGIEFYALQVANVQMQQGKYVDAEWTLRDRLTHNLKALGRNAPLVTWLANGLASVYAEQGRYADAAALAKAALEGIVRSGTPPESGYVLDTRLTLAKAHVGLEQWREASSEFSLITQAARGAAAGHIAASGSPEIAVALVRAGDAKAAREMMRVIAQRLESSLGPNHYRTAEAQGVLAMTLAKSGEVNAALKLFPQALATMLELEAQAGETGSGGLRRSKLVWIIEAYLELLAARHQAGDADAAGEAFRVADVARAQRVQRAVSASAARVAAATPELAELVRKEQDLGHEVAALYKFLADQLQRPAEQQSQKIMADMRARIERIAGERSALLKQIEQLFPAYANLISPKPPTLATARQALKEGEALVSVYSAEDMTYLWATKKDGATTFATVSIPRSTLQARIGKLLEGVIVPSPYADAVPKFDVALAYELSKTLLAPVASGWNGAKSLLVVPHGPAAMIPFAMLPTAAGPASSASGLLFAEYRNVPWLAREASITQLPSVNALVTLRAQPPAKPGRSAFAGFGDPIFNPKDAPAVKTELAARGIPLTVRSAAQTSSLASARLENLPRLPDTADEIRALAQTLGAQESESVFLSRRANEKEVKAASLANRRILAFATHGLVAGDLDGLTQPALALTAPDVAGVDGDGLLTMEEVLALQLDADWVILSACNTAAGEGAGAEAISGLGRAFFYAGSRSLLVSNWPVETVSAKKLTTSTIERYAKANLPRAEALRQAMLELLDRGEASGADGKPLYAYAHPLFWAPFSVIGEGN